MPTAQRTPLGASRRDSYPPTQMRIFSSIEEDDAHMQMNAHNNNEEDDLSFDPITAFLTPTPLLEDGDTDDENDNGIDLDLDMDLDMTDFDAGIEVPHSPSSPVIRSVSPSKLASFSPSSPRSIPSPFCTSPSPTTSSSRNSSPPQLSRSPGPNGDDDDDDDDEEDYVRLTPLSFAGLHIPTFNLGSSKSKGRARKAAAMTRTTSSESALAPSPLIHPFSAPASRQHGFVVGRRPLLPVRPQSWSGPGAGRTSPRAWREPSPDVWRIEEEEEEKEEGDIEIDVRGRRAGTRRRQDGEAKKRVRFVLPVREEIP